MYLVSLAMAALLMDTPAFAGPQQSWDSVVVVTGTAVLQRQPDLLRVQVDLLAKGKDLKGALAKLKTRQEAARTRLATLTPIQGSVEIGDPVLSTGKSDRQRLLEILQRRGRVKKPAAPAREPAAVIVSAPFKADLPLGASNAEDLLIRATELQDHIRDWDLGGLKELQPPALPDEDPADDDPSEVKFGEVSFRFVRKISSEEQAKVLAEAFQNARGEAVRLARAAGTELDTLRYLQHQVNSEGEEVSPSPNELLRAATGRPRPTVEVHPGPPEATGQQAGKVTYRVILTAAFGLKPAR
jgi:uncharacterized protein YggE